jgi:hypothetical protein
LSDRFDDLVGDVADPEERARLLRVHELLLAADPPPELSPAVGETPAPPATRLVLRRPRTLALAAAAAVLVAFGAGWLAGARSDDPEIVREIPMAGTADAPGAFATIEMLERDASGNWPMRVLVRGLPASDGPEDAYELWLTREGEIAESCGVFTVHRGVTEVTLSVPYSFRGVDGWVVTRRGDDEILLTT